MFNATYSHAIIYKPKNIFSIFFWISAILIKFVILWEKRWTSGVICFWNYILQKTGLLKCRKNPVSENLLTVNMLKGPKECLNLHSTILSYFFNTLKVNQLQNSVLVESEIFRLFVNIYKADEKYSLSVKASV